MLTRVRLPNSVSLMSRLGSGSVKLSNARQFSLQAGRPMARSNLMFSSKPATPIFRSALLLNSTRSVSFTASLQPVGPETPGQIPVDQTTLAIPSVNGRAERTVAANSDPSAEAATDGASMAGPVNPEISQPIDQGSLTSSFPPPPVADGYTSTDPANILPQPPATADVPTIESLIAANPDNIADVLASPEAVHAAMKIGDLKLMGMTHSFINPAGWLRDALEAIHVGFGIPWWGTIMLTTACLRLALFPLIVRMQAHNSRMSAIQEQQKALMQKMTDAKQRNDMQAGGVYAGQLQQLWKEHDVHPLRSLGLPLLQMPLFVAFFFAIRKMADLPVPQFKEGGLAWFTDLTAADPYYVLPITSMALTLAVMQVGADGLGGNKTRTQQHTVNAMRVISVLAIPFVAKMSAALTFYWTFSNSLTLLQTFIISSKSFKRALGIKAPPTIPLPPGHKPIPPPSTLDTFREGKEWLLKRSRDEAEKQVKMRMAARKGQVKAVEASPLQTVEVIREGGKVMNSVDTSVFAEPEKLQAPVAKKKGRSIDHEKEARVAAARAKRAKQGGR